MFYNATEQKLIIIINDRTVKYNSLFKRSKYGENKNNCNTKILAYLKEH